MNYAKVIGAALQLFPKKIKVTLIDAVTGNNIGIHKMSIEQLPQQFNRPVVIEEEGVRWQVLKSNAVTADDYTFSRKLTLHVQKAVNLELPGNRYWVPTIPDPCPPALANYVLFDDFILDIPGFEWRQLEFLPQSILPVIQREMEDIELIRSPGNGENLLLGFTSMYVRNRIGARQLSISLDDFCALVNVCEKGAVRLTSSDEELVQDGFAIKTANYTYYGIVQNGYLTELCLPDFDSADDEFISVITQYGLVLVDWCNASVIMGWGEMPVGDVQEAATDELLPLL